MTPTAAFVVFAVYWFLVMFVTLQITVSTQRDEGHVVPGTPPSAPANFNLKRTLIIVSLITSVLWAVTLAIIVYGGITLEDIDWRNTLDRA